MDITTKYSLGDIVWYLAPTRDNGHCPTCGHQLKSNTISHKPKRGEVKEIMTNHTSLATTIQYKVSGRHSSLEEYEVFSSKSEALENT